MTVSPTQVDSTSHRRGAQLGYRPALDGIRALAVVAVMLYHGGVTWMSGGFLGVDVFFVLSGFLITALLIREWNRKGRIDLRQFWLRRARRLIPAMLVVVLAVTAYAAVISGEQQLTLRGDALATMGYVANWWFVSSGQSYFARFAEPSALRHTWSLAIEEQFYILFPLVVIVVVGRLKLGTRGLRFLLAIGVLASAALMFHLYEPLSDPSRVYYGTDTRMQALLLGGVIALVPALTRAVPMAYTRVLGRVVGVSGSGFVGWLALGGLVWMFFAARELAPWMYQGGFLLAATLSGALIAAVTRAPHSLIARMLSWRPVVAVGVVSYGLYLWHWPVFVALSHQRTGLEGTGLLAARFSVTGLLAYASYRLVEEPIRTQRFQARLTRTQWHRFMGLTAAGLTAAVLGVTTGVSIQLAPTVTDSAGRSEPVADSRGRLVNVFLLGDSQSYGLRVYYVNQVDGLAVNGSTQLGCGTLLPERHMGGQTIPNIPACVEWEPRWIQEIARERPDLVVIMLGLGELYDRQVDDEVVRFGTPAYREWLYREIHHRRSLIEPLAGRVALTTALCMGISADAADRSAQIANDPQRLAWLNETITEYGRVHPEVAIIDLHATVCADGYRELIDGKDIRDDGLHLNQAGAEIVWERIGPALVDAAS